MKASDLSIGDFVFIKSKNKIGVVHEIYSRSAHVWCGETYGSIYADRYGYDDIAPIALTPEILEKNSWVWTAYGIIHGGEDITLKQSGDYWNIKPNQLSDDIFCSIWYVHELQHALRLCGLDELADNFKV